MAWADIPLNKIITESELSTSGITGSYSVSDASRAVTKSRLQASSLNYNIYNPTLSTKNSNQLLAKRDVEQAISSGCILFDCFVGYTSIGIVKDIKLQIESSSPSNSIAAYAGLPVTHDTDILSRRRRPASTNVADCYIVAPLSETTNGSLYWYRLGINLTKIKAMYPSETSFTFGIYQQGLTNDADGYSKIAHITNSIKQSSLIDITPQNGIDFNSLYPEAINNITDSWTTSSVGVYGYKKVANIIYYSTKEYYTLTQL